MRLSSEQQEGICKAIGSLLPKAAKGRLFLFGSRVDDSLKGGDIDLLLLLQEPTSAASKHIFLNEIKKNIGDQRVDLVISSLDPKNHSIFVAEILKHAKIIEDFMPG